MSATLILALLVVLVATDPDFREPGSPATPLPPKPPAPPPMKLADYIPRITALVLLAVLVLFLVRH